MKRRSRYAAEWLTTLKIGRSRRSKLGRSQGARLQDADDALSVVESQ